MSVHLDVVGGTPGEVLVVQVAFTDADLLAIQHLAQGHSVPGFIRSFLSEFPALAQVRQPIPTLAEVVSLEEVFGEDL